MKRWWIGLSALLMLIVSLGCGAREKAKNSNLDVPRPAPNSGNDLSDKK